MDPLSRRGQPVPVGLWAAGILALVAWAVSAHLFAWMKVLAAGTIDGFARVDARTRFAWEAFHHVHHRPWIWVLAALVPIIAAGWCRHRRYGPLLSLWVFILVALPLLCYGFVVGGLGAKILESPG